jgi:alpha-tubulin suppressor-like RCC1 family protein
MCTIALDRDGYVWATGARAYAGFPSSNNYKTIEEEREFKRIPDLKKFRFLHISVAEFHALAIRTTLEVYGWGKSEYGKLAQDTFVSVSTSEGQLKNIILPKKIEKLSDAKYVSAGANHSYCLSINNEAISWGCALAGRLGISQDDMKLLREMNIMKNEYNVMILKQPYQLKFSWEEGKLCNYISNSFYRDGTARILLYKT